MTDLLPQSIKLRTDQIVILKKLGINLSEWTREKFDESFLNVEEVDKKIKEYQESIKKMRNHKKEIKKLISEFSEEEKDYLLESENILLNKGNIPKGRIDGYTKQFKKPCHSLEDFLKLIKKVKSKNGNRN